jgi:ornithine cyclodeaminase/alanine dehydrogenase-like protein (mu-crystallin family)
VVVGSGRVGYYAALYAVAAAGVRAVTFCDRLPGRADEAARTLAGVSPGVHCEARPAAEVASADAVVLATTSSVPVASPPCWGARLVVSLGADTDTQSELDPAWADQAEIYCDTLDSLRFGDLRAWVAAGRVQPAAARELLDVLRAPPPASPRPRVFISTGSALFDNLTARYLLDQADR